MPVLSLLSDAKYNILCCESSRWRFLRRVSVIAVSFHVEGSLFGGIFVLLGILLARPSQYWSLLKSLYWSSLNSARFALCPTSYCGIVLLYFTPSNWAGSTRFYTARLMKFSSILFSENGEVGPAWKRAGSTSIWDSGCPDLPKVSCLGSRTMSDSGTCPNVWVVSSRSISLSYSLRSDVQMVSWSSSISNCSPSSLSPSGWSDPPRSQSTISSYLTAEGEWIATRDQGSLCSYTSLFNCSRELLNPFSWSDLLRSQHYLVFLEWPRKGTQWTYSLRAVAKWSSRLTFLHWEIILRPEPQISGHGISLAG